MCAIDPKHFPSQNWKISEVHSYPRTLYDMWENAPKTNQKRDQGALQADQVIKKKKKAPNI